MKMRDLLLLGLFVVIAFVAAVVVFLLVGQDGKQPEATSVAASTMAASPSLTPQASATLMHTPEPTPSPTASQTPEPAPTETPCVPPEGWVVYTVLPGETLFSIAARYGMSAEELQQANCLPSAGEIQSGQSLYVPWQITPTPTPCFPPASWVPYTVLPGETLYSIAARYGLTAGQVQQANCLSSAGALRAGQDLYVPYLIPPTQAIPPLPAEGGGFGGGEPEAVAGLKEEIFFDPGGGGDAPDCGTPEPGTPLPAVTISDRLLEFYRACAHGFPLGEEVTVELYAPAGHLVSSRVYEVDTVIEGQTIIILDLWFPVGLEYGAWRVVGRSATDVAEETLEIPRPTEPAASTMPEGDIDPFEFLICSEYSAGEAVVIRGASFEPNGVVRLGIYWFTGTTDDQDRPILSLVQETSANTDAWGDFATTVFVGASDPSGSYAVVPVTDPGADWYDSSKPAISCYEVP
jgi:LysM repeat protein